MKKDFMLVILGCDENAYGFAKVMHSKYQIKPVVLTTNILEVCKYTKIMDIRVDHNLHDYNHFLKVLTHLGGKLKCNYEKLVIVPCSDVYLELLVRGKDYLKDYENKFIDYKTLKKFKDKMSFYEECDKYNLPYPKTLIVNKNNYQEKIKKMDFDYPLILKPNNSNSEEYLNLNFIGKEKVYFINNKEELVNKLDLIYKTNYQDKMIIQKYIKGDDTFMRVLNVYSDKNGVVQRMSLGKVLLEEYHPKTFGNYAAIISIRGMEPIMEKIKNYLENISFTGATNFDIKIDAETKEYYILEINPRPGRSSYYTTLAGASIQEAYIEDLVYDRIDKKLGNTKEMLWLNIPICLLKKYIKDDEVLNKIKELKNEKKIYHTLKYQNDWSIKRHYILYLQYLRKIHYFPKHYIKNKKVL